MPAQTKKEQIQADVPGASRFEKRIPEKDLFSWKAPARPFKRRDREFWIKIIAIASVIGLIVFIIEGIMPVILLISVFFLFYILSTVEPDVIEYKITNKGIKIAEKRTNWELLTRFWFGGRFDSELLIFEMLVMPGRLELVVNAVDKESIRKAVSSQIPEEEVPPSSLDRAANWFSKKLPQ